MELFADDIAAFMQAIGIERAHVSGLSLGAATGLWLAGKYPQWVKSVSLHSCWPKSDAFLKTVVGGWQSTAKGLNSVTEMIIQGKGARYASEGGTPLFLTANSLTSLGQSTGKLCTLAPARAKRRGGLRGGGLS